MNMYCDDCGRDDICLCVETLRTYPDATAAAVEVMRAALAHVEADPDALPGHAPRLRHAIYWISGLEVARAPRLEVAHPAVRRVCPVFACGESRPHLHKTNLGDQWYCR